MATDIHLLYHLISENTEEEYCPSCGTWVSFLIDETGWCPSCSGMNGHHPSLNEGICVKCTRRFAPDGLHVTCPACRREAWLERNADEIEKHLANGFSFTQAQDRVRESNRATCLSCGSTIKGRRHDTAFFCKKNPECRFASRRFRTLSERYSSAEALLLVVMEVNLHKHYKKVRSQSADEASAIDDFKRAYGQILKPPEQ